MKQYVYAKAISRSGFGVEGVFDKAALDASTKKIDGLPVVDDDALIVGVGPGWEDNGVFDAEWLKRACELMNNAAIASSKVDWAYPTIEDYENMVGFKVGDAFRIGWAMARTTNRMFGNRSAKGSDKP